MKYSDVIDFINDVNSARQTGSAIVNAFSWVRS